MTSWVNLLQRKIQDITICGRNLRLDNPKKSKGDPNIVNGQNYNLLICSLIEI